MKKNGNVNPVFLRIIFFIAIIGVSLTTCDNGSSSTNEQNQTPSASDFEIGNLTQTVGNITPVTITPKAGKSIGVITIFYNGSTVLPAAIGTYPVTFNVAAVTGWNAVNGLFAGILTINENNPNNQTPVASDYEIGNLNQTAGSIIPVTIIPKAEKSTGEVTVYYNGSTTLPTVTGTYTVTFDVTAVTGWNVAIGLVGGILTINTSNQTPVASDYTIGNLAQTAGSVTAVTITANNGKSPGVVSNIRYNGSAIIPQTAGTYAVSFDVAAATGWNATTELAGGSLIVSSLLSEIIIDLGGMNEWEMIEQNVYAAANLNKTFAVNGTFSTYQWYLDGSLVGTSSGYIFNKSIKDVYQLIVVVTNSNGESRSGRCRITLVDHPLMLTANTWVNSNITIADGEDWYSFPVINGTRYYIWWNGVNQGNGTKNGRVVVSARYSNSSSWIFGGTNTTVLNGWSASQSFIANRTGTVYIRVIPSGRNISNIGTYGIVYGTNPRPEVQ